MSAAQVMPFTYEHAAEVRLVVIDGEPWFVLAGVLPAHKKNPASRRSPWLITPAEHREYRRRATGVT